MPTADQVNKDRRFIDRTLSLLLSDLATEATKDVAAYNKTFMPNSEYINSHLNARVREYSLFSEQEYYRYIRLLMRKLVEMIACLQSPGSGDRVLTVIHLVDDITDARTFENVKGHVNDLLALAARMRNVA